MRLAGAKLIAAAFLAGLQLSQQAPTIASLARDIERVESVREIKDLQRSFSQLAQFGRRTEQAALFSDSGVLRWGNETATGPKAIEAWLLRDAGAMDGVQPGSLDTLVAENPLVTLSVDGKSAKARWNGLRFQGDGKGKTRIQGGIYENEYIFNSGRWKISLLNYYPLYAGTYAGGFKNVGGGLPIVPYHFTPDETGVPIPPPIGEAPATRLTARNLTRKINRLNDEDEVRNLQNAFGYYVDRRMWTDVIDLFVSDAIVSIEGVGTFTGANGVHQAMARMGNEGLTRGILNDHPYFVTLVSINPNGRQAITRGTEIGFLGNANTHTASWEFSVFRNTFVKQNGMWKIKELNLTPLIAANYTTGWGYGGTLSPTDVVPDFLDVAARSSRAIQAERTNTSLTDMQRRLARSAAYDGTENESSAYGYYLDDLQCDRMGAIHAKKGHKSSPFAGWFQTPERVAGACRTQYGSNRSALRNSISFHWRPQPVIIVSEDGRSASHRSRLLQPSTSLNSSGAFNGAIYHDQMVLEDGKWKLWSITIDEFYWQSTNWTAGWANPNPPKANATESPSALLTKYPPDITLVQTGDRESTFRGGRGTSINWPEIQRMWFAYRNPVSGRLPQYYWPGCVPCHSEAGKSWSLEANGYQEPPTGPTNVVATSAVSITSGTAAIVNVSVAAGPGEPVTGVVELREDETIYGSASLANSKVTFAVPGNLSEGTHTFIAYYLGSDHLKPGQGSTTVTITDPAEPQETGSDNGTPPEEDEDEDQRRLF